MPKSLQIHNNERLDIPDFELAANGYTRESLNHFIRNGVIDTKSRTFRGFRIELADQASFAGQITVHNGVVFDMDGQVINIEDQPDASKTTTLIGSNQTFYVELEFTDGESDVDGRGFWDPTVSNTAPNPNGAEVTINVSTRRTPSWKIVTPVSTSGFTTGTTRIPLAVFSTNASGQITSAVNSFGSLVQASTVTTYAAGIGATQLRVVDSTLIPIGSTITVDFGAGSAETGITVTANDMEQGILTINPVLSSAHAGGAIVRRTDLAASLVKQSVNPNDPNFASGVSTVRPNDWLSRMWQGDELRGDALIHSKETYGQRDDLNLSNLKDYVDVLAAQLRELKFGAASPLTTSVAPPSSFPATLRYFSQIGSVSGARGFTVTIGNGTTNRGDFNGTNQQPFIDAVAFIVATGNAGTIYVKPGTYTFVSSVTIPAGVDVSIVGESRESVSIVNTTVGAGFGAFILADDSETTVTRFSNLTTSIVAPSTLFLSSVNSPGQVYFDNCVVAGVGFAESISLNMTNCSLTATCIVVHIHDSQFINCSATALPSNVLAIFFLGENLSFSKCAFSSDVSVITASGAINGMSIDKCAFEGSVATNTNPLILASGSEDWTITNSSFLKNVNASGFATSTSLIRVSGIAQNFNVYGNVFSTTIPSNTTLTNLVYLVELGTVSALNCVVKNNTFRGGAFSYTISLKFSGSTLNSKVLDNEFVQGYRSISWEDSTGSIVIDGNKFVLSDAIENYCIDIQNTSATLTTIISNNIFQGSNTSTDFTKMAIRLNTVTNMDITVANCKFYEFGHSALVGGTNVISITGGSATGSFLVTDCTFEDCKASSNLSIINISSTALAAFSLIIDGCVFRNCDTASSGTSNVIRLDLIRLIKITDCVFQNVTDMRCVNSTSCSSLQVLNCNAGTDGTNLTADFVRASGNMTLFSVSNNTVGTSADQAIYHGSNVQPVNVVITGNLINHAAATSGDGTIRLDAGVDSGSSGVISNNNILSTGVAITPAIFASDYSRLSVVGNTIQVFGVSAVNILIVTVMVSASFETVPAGTISGNSISGVPAGGQYNIFATGTGPVAVVGNTCGTTKISNTSTGGVTASNA